MTPTHIQKQILYKAIKDPVFAKDIFSQLPTKSFDEEKSYAEIALLINRHYQTKNEPLGKEALLVLAEDRLFKQQANADKQQEQYAIITDIYTVDPYIDTDESIQDNIMKYVRKTLSQNVILKAVAKGNLEEENTITDIVQNLQKVMMLSAGSGGDSINFFQDVERKAHLLSNMNKNKFSTGFRAVDEIADGGLSRGELGLINASYGNGKALTNNSPVKTPLGDVLISALQVGDKVFGTDGKPQTVIGVFPQGKKRVYEVEFSDGTIVECNDEHLWTYQTLGMRARKKGQWRTKTLRDIMETEKLKNRHGQNLIYLPMAQPVDYGEKDLPIDPYLLGALIGDGGLTSGIRFSNSEEDVLERVTDKLVEWGLALVPIGGCDYRITSPTKDYENLGLFTQALKEVGLHKVGSRDKRIPTMYLQGSISQRRALLAGLIDTDGSIEGGSSYEYSTVSQELAVQVQELVNSLGLTAKLSVRINPQYTYKEEKRTGQDNYRVRIKPSKQLPKLHNSAKHESHWKEGQSSARRTIRAIRETDRWDEMTCISVDSKDKLFLTTSFIPTHNTTFGVNLAYNYIVQGLNVLFLPLEEKLDRMVLRFEQRLSKQPKSSIMAGGQLNRNLFDVTQQAYQQFTNPKNQGKGWGEFIISKYMPRTLSPSGLEQEIINQTLVLGKQIDVVIIDYPDLMDNPFMRGSDNESRAGGMLIEEIRRISQEYNFVGWVFSQLNRSGTSNELRTAQMIEGSKQKLNPVEIAMTINQTPQEQEANFTRLYVDKLRNRTHANFDRQLVFRYVDEFMQLRDITEEERFAHQAIISTMDESVTGYQQTKKKEHTREDAINAVNDFNQTVQPLR